MLALATLSVVGIALTQQGLGSLGPALMVEFNLDRMHLGFAFGMATLGSALLVLPAGLAVDAWGERRLMLLSGLVMGTALIAATLVHAYWWLLLCLGIAGLGPAASWPAGVRAIYVWFERDRAAALGVRQTGNPLGGAIGALLLPVFAIAGGYRAAFLCAGTICIVATLIAATFYHEPPGSSPARRTLGEMLAAMRGLLTDTRVRLVTVTGMLLSVTQYISVAFLAVTLIALAHLSVREAGFALSVGLVGSCFGRLGWGYISDRCFNGDRLLPMVFLAIITAITSLAVSCVTAHTPLIAELSLAFILGSSALGWNGLFAAALVEIGGVQLSGSALGIASTGVFFTGIVVTPLFGRIVDVHGFPVAWMILAGVSMLSIWPALCARNALRQGIRTLKFTVPKVNQGAVLGVYRTLGWDDVLPFTGTPGFSHRAKILLDDFSLSPILGSAKSSIAPLKGSASSHPKVR
jgi:sugar phosphate permease